MSPIYVRPAREQSEHDRLIRHLQTKYKSKKFEVAANIDGVEPVTFVKIGPATLAPDLVFIEGKKLVGLVEVETGESVNNLEAMAQWVHFSQARVPFHLYVPVHGYEAARRLCESYGARVGEIWTYRPTHEGFDLVRMHADAAAASGTRGIKALPVSIVIPVTPKPVPKPIEAAEAPQPPVAPAKTAVPLPAKPSAKAATSPPVKPLPDQGKPVVKAAANGKGKAKPVPAAQPAKAANRPAVAKPSAKPAKAKSAKAKPVKVVARPTKSKGRAKAVPKGKKPAVARGKKATISRGKKAAPRRGR